MRLHLIGGLSDGDTVDTDNPNGWAWGEDDFPAGMLPDTLTCHAARANRTVYRLTRADGSEGWYHVDFPATAYSRATMSR